MVVRAVLFFATLCLALWHLVVFWMEVAFFPAVRFRAVFSFIACIFVIVNRLVLVPFFTDLGLIKVDFVFAPVVLPVVSVHASIPLMSFLVIRTPNRLEVKHVEVFVFLKQVNQINRNFILTVSEWAKFSVLTITCILGITSAKLGFVLGRMVKNLHLVVGKSAIFLWWALLFAPYIVAYYGTICA